MPARSQAQQRLMAIAEHNPSAVYSRNAGVLKMSHSQLHDFAATPRKGKPQHVRLSRSAKVHTSVPHPHRNLGKYLHPRKGR